MNSEPKKRPLRVFATLHDDLEEQEEDNSSEYSNTDSENNVSGFSGSHKGTPAKKSAKEV